MLARMKGLLLSRWTAVIIGVVCLAGLVMLVAPLIPVGGERPFEGGPARMMLGVLVPVSAGVFALIGSRVQQGLNMRVAEALTMPGATAAAPSGPGSPAGTAAAAQAVETLNTRFRDALAVLRKRRFGSARGRRWLYQLPWYVMIGPPGSGKTTAITNSGLSFPLADRLGRSAVSGIGGTRNCDWWFTDDAVLIDTAGRYTTQDSDAEQDKAAWLGFLRLLRKYRRRQPLNGVLVAIGIRDLGEATDEQRLDHAARIRDRIKELYRELGTRLPVYVLFTKADLIAGFTEYFDDLGREGRESVWGISFQPETPEPEGGTVQRYRGEFDALVGRLDERLLERTQQEGDVERRALVFGFPQQVLSLQDLTAEFLRDIFEPNSFDEPIMLRGVYFVSGTQVGTPLDRVTEAMARSFGITHRPQPALGGKTRSFFLSRLLREVVFGEAGLVDADPRIERRLQRLYKAFYALTAVVVVAASGTWIASFVANAALIDRVQAAATDYAGQANRLHLERVDDSDLRPIVPLLDRLRDIETGYGDTTKPPLLRTGFGLGQDRKLGSQTRAAYRQALGTVLLPRLVLRLENELAAHANAPDFLYPGLKVYLMLGHQGPLDRETVRRWMALDFASAFPREQDTEFRDAIGRHVAAMLETPFPDMGLNGDLIESTRAALRKLPLARRVLDSIVASKQAAALPPWTLADNVGPGGADVMRRRSGQPLGTGIPGIYTREGFYGTFLPMLPKVADSAMQDAWVLGTAPAGAGDPAPAEALKRDATSLYLAEFALRWDQLLGDVAVRPATTLDDSLRVLNTLSAPTSPIRLLVVSMAGQTALDHPPAKPDKAGGGGGAAPGKPDGMATLFAAPAAPDTPDGAAAHYSQEHFKALHQLVDVPPNSEPGAQPPIDSAIRDVGTLYRSLSQMQTQMQSGGGGLPQLGEGSGALAQVEASGASLPEPIRGWVLGVSKSSSSLSLDQARGRLQSLWTGTAGQFCQRATTGRYPFVKGASEETTPTDFGKLLGKGGAIDSFFTQTLMPSVDMSRDPWVWRASAKGGVALDRASLAQFQRAAAIRDSLFQGSEGEPTVSFALTVGPLDAGVTSIKFQLGDKTLEVRAGQSPRMRFHWSGGSDTDSAALSVEAPGAAPASLTGAGPWALFRLLDQGSVEGGGAADRFTARFVVGGHPVTLLLQADSIQNPFAGRLLTRFRCPAMP